MSVAGGPEGEMRRGWTLDLSVVCAYCFVASHTAIPVISLKNRSGWRARQQANQSHFRSFDFLCFCCRSLVVLLSLSAASSSRVMKIPSSAASAARDALLHFMRWALVVTTSLSLEHSSPALDSDGRSHSYTNQLKVRYIGSRYASPLRSATRPRNVQIRPKAKRQEPTRLPAFTTLSSVVFHQAHHMEQERSFPPNNRHDQRSLYAGMKTVNSNGVLFSALKVATSSLRSWIVLSRRYTVLLRLRAMSLRVRRSSTSRSRINSRLTCGVTVLPSADLQEKARGAKGGDGDESASQWINTQPLYGSSLDDERTKLR
jgi:hypothetical protein